MKISKIILPLILMTVLLGCTKDFRGTNTNNNNPTEVTPDLLLSGVIRNMLNQQVNDAWGIGNLVAQYHAKIQFVNEDRYLWNEQNGLWNAVYSNNRNLQNILIAVEKDSKSPYLGVGLILKSWMFSLATNAYGDIPYREAGKAKSESIYTPVYDTQEDVYTAILADLKKANDLLTTSNTGLSGDILFGGGAAGIIKWRKLANSLRLRLLLRMSNKKDVSAEMQAIVSNPTINPIFTSNDDNAELKYLAAAPNQWPLYGSRVGSFDEIRVSKTLSDRLIALNDTRINVFARPSQSSILGGTPKAEGIPNGLDDVAALNYNGGPQGVSRVGYTFACLVCNDPGQAVADPSAPRAILMNFSELQFILAEAREKSLISTGTAETYYTNGINANFSYWKSLVPTQYNVNLNMPSGYLIQPQVAFTGSQADKLAKIALQKWIALYFNGLEAWFEWRRTGMPEIIPGTANLNSNKVPIRYVYPLSEQSLNGVNRSKAVTAQGGTDDINTKMWLLK